MRKLLITLVLASAAATPALAAPEEDVSTREQARAERQQAREQARSERAERAARPERAERVERTIEARQSFDGPARGEANARADARDIETIRAAREGRRDPADSVRNWQMEQRQQRVETRDQRLDQMRDNRGLRQAQRPLPPILRNRVPVVSSEPREGTQPPLPTATRSTPAPQWSTSWRNNKKYNWSDWRRRNWWLFNLGFYYDPFGWRYQPYSIGWRMWPSYYSSRYWLHDPWQYRLPYAPPGYRWVRYWDDAILVDTWTGEVVDVIYNFFW